MRPAAALALALVLAAPALAEPPPPPDLAELQGAAVGSGTASGPASGGERRAAAQRLAALAYGSQGGLARRAWEIARTVAIDADALDRTYDFEALLLERGGFRVLPPVLGETRRAYRLDPDGRRATAAHRVVRIVEPARIVSAAPTWRAWLLRDWEAPKRPADLLFPRNAAERSRWRGWIAEGWAEGIRLADDIFAAQVDALDAAFQGIAAWHRLHMAGMVTEPELDLDASDVSGGGTLMRIDERWLSVAGEARLRPEPDLWRPLSASAAGEPQ